MKSNNYDDWDEGEYCVVRDGYRFTVNWASKGMPLLPFTRAIGLFEFILNEVINGTDSVLATRRPIKAGVVCQRVKGWKPSVPRIIYKEWLLDGADVRQRMDELLALVNEGHFDHLKPGKS